ncbi:MAG: hypothetical protein HN980_05175 [Waddliaceae bacterium]|nr:hypothetical protein [Waddliaceae bacterium]
MKPRPPERNSLQPLWAEQPYYPDYEKVEAAALDERECDTTDTVEITRKELNKTRELVEAILKGTGVRKTPLPSPYLSDIESRVFSILGSFNLQEKHTIPTLIVEKPPAPKQEIEERPSEPLDPVQAIEASLKDPKKSSSDVFRSVASQYIEHKDAGYFLLELLKSEEFTKDTYSEAEKKARRESCVTIVMRLIQSGDDDAAMEMLKEAENALGKGEVRSMYGAVSQKCQKEEQLIPSLERLALQANAKRVFSKSKQRATFFKGAINSFCGRHTEVAINCAMNIEGEIRYTYGFKEESVGYLCSIVKSWTECSTDDAIDKACDMLCKYKDTDKFRAEKKHKCEIAKAYYSVVEALVKKGDVIRAEEFFKESEERGLTCLAWKEAKKCFDTITGKKLSESSDAMSVLSIVKDVIAAHEIAKGNRSTISSEIITAAITKVADLIEYKPSTDDLDIIETLMRIGCRDVTAAEKRKAVWKKLVAWNIEDKRHVKAYKIFQECEIRKDLFPEERFSFIAHLLPLIKKDEANRLTESFKEHIRNRTVDTLFAGVRSVQDMAKAMDELSSAGRTTQRPAFVIDVAKMFSAMERKKSPLFSNNLVPEEARKFYLKTIGLLCQMKNKKLKDDAREVAGNVLILSIKNGVFSSSSEEEKQSLVQFFKQTVNYNAAKATVKNIRQARLLLKSAVEDTAELFSDDDKTAMAEKIVEGYADLMIQPGTYFNCAIQECMKSVVGIIDGKEIAKKILKKTVERFSQTTKEIRDELEVMKAAKKSTEKSATKEYEEAKSRCDDAIEKQNPAIREIITFFNKMQNSICWKTHSAYGCMNRELVMGMIEQLSISKARIGVEDIRHITEIVESDASGFKESGEVRDDDEDNAFYDMLIKTYIVTIKTEASKYECYEYSTRMFAAFEKSDSFLHRMEGEKKTVLLMAKFGALYEAVGQKYNAMTAFVEKNEFLVENLAKMFDLWLELERVCDKEKYKGKEREIITQRLLFLGVQLFGKTDSEQEEEQGLCLKKLFYSSLSDGIKKLGVTDLINRASNEEIPAELMLRTAHILEAPFLGDIGETKLDGEAFLKKYGYLKFYLSLGKSSES